MKKYRLEELTPADVETINALTPEGWSSIQKIHQHYMHSKDCHCIKAVLDDQIIGLGTGIAFGHTAWIAHIIVSKDHQRKGIGNAIVCDRIDFLQRERGCKTFSLTATDQGYPVYKKIGFTDESLYIMMKKTDPNIPIGGPVSPYIIRIQEKHIKEALAIDSLVSGENRHDFLYPALFHGYVYEKNNKVEGFYISDFGDCGVSALTEEAGIALLHERMKEERSIYIPEKNDTAYRYLIDNGFTEVRRIHLMILGDSFERKPGLNFSRIGGFAG